MKFDDLLVAVGEFGPAQRRLFFLLSLPAIYYAIMNILVSVFLFAVPLHRCSVPGMDNDTYEVQGVEHSILANQTIPRMPGNNGDSKYSSCDLYSTTNGTNGPVYDNNNVTKPCHKWVYDKSVYESTVSQSLDFVCSRKSYPTHAKSVSMGGKFIGAIVSGPLSDMFGRRKLILVSATSSVILSIVITWTNSSYMLFPMLLLLLTSLNTMYLTCFVFIMEIVGPSKRMQTGVAVNLFWSIGNMVLALAAYLLRDWKTRQLVLAVPGIVFVYLFFLPESPRWLMRKGRTEEAEKEIRKIADRNKVDLPADCFYNTDVLTSDEGHGEQFWEMLKSPFLVKRLTIICYNWFAVGMCFYGLSMNVTNLSGNVYFNYFLFVIVETCAYVICLFLIKRVHRKRLLCASMLLAGISCISTFIPFLISPSPENWIINILACLGNTCVSIGYAVVYVFTAELIPTTSRNFGMGVSSMSSRVGSVIAPYINDLTLHISGRYSQILPMLIFGGVTTVAGLLALLLPETQNKNLPETVQDAKRLGTETGNYEMQSVTS